MKILMALLVCCFTLSASVVAEEKAKVTKADGHVIPVDSKSEWDFRGKVSPFMMGSKTAKKLPECKTYEELRDMLKVVYKEFCGSGA